MNKITTRVIAGSAILTAIEIILQFLGNYLTIAGVININLALLPISIAGILYGPLAGLFLGLVNGVMAIFSPSTMSVFMPINAIGTVVTCLVKGMAAGVISGLIYKFFKNKTYGTIVSSISVPLINTGLFICFCLLFFQKFLIDGSSSYANKYAFLFFGVIGWNFIFEFLTTIILTPSIIKIVNIVKKRNATNN